MSREINGIGGCVEDVPKRGCIYVRWSDSGAVDGGLGGVDCEFDDGTSRSAPPYVPNGVSALLRETLCPAPSSEFSRSVYRSIGLSGPIGHR
jgi:hypothetical protein